MATSVLRTVIVDSDPTARAAIRHALATVPAIVIVGEHADVTDAALKAPASRPDVMIVEVPIDPAQGEAWSAAAIERLARRLPDTAILATTDNATAEFVVQIIRAGGRTPWRRRG